MQVPAGTLVCCVMRHDSVSERHFADAAALRARNAGWPTATPGRRPASAKRVSMPFGAGPRICPGRYLALLEMKMAMATLLGRFDIADGRHARRRRRARSMAFTMAPVGLRMRLRERTA